MDHTETFSVDFVLHPGKYCAFFSGRSIPKGVLVWTVWFAESEVSLFRRETEKAMRSMQRWRFTEQKSVRSHEHIEGLVKTPRALRLCKRAAASTYVHTHIIYTHTNTHTHKHTHTNTHPCSLANMHIFAKIISTCTYPRTHTHTYKHTSVPCQRHGMLITYTLLLSVLEKAMANMSKLKFTFFTHAVPDQHHAAPHQCHAGSNNATLVLNIATLVSILPR